MSAPSWAFPYRIDRTGRTATEVEDAHVRDLVEQVLLTSPGERVMRPDFGAGVLGLVFEPGGPELAATAQYLVRGALERWLGTVVAVEDVMVTADDSSVIVTVAYLVLSTRTRAVVDFRAPAVGT